MARTKKGRAASGGKQGASGKRRAVHGLANVPTSKLRAELDRRSQELGNLEKQRTQLMAELQAIDATLADFGISTAGYVRKRGPGRPPGSGAARGSRKRPRNETNLVDALAKTLNGKTMGVSEVSDAVQADGYKTTSPNFRTIVNQALISNPKVFRKVARGQYTAK